MSLHNKLKTWSIDGASFNEYAPELFNEIINFEVKHYEMKNELSDTEDELEQCRYREKQLLIENDKLKLVGSELQKEKLELMHQVVRNTHKDELTEISKKIKKDMKKSFRDVDGKTKKATFDWLAEIALKKATILDHFTIAYMGDTGLAPKDVKLVQNKLENGSIEFIFEKNSELILPGIV